MDQDKIDVSVIFTTNQNKLAKSFDMSYSEFRIVNELLNWMRSTKYGKMEVTRHENNINISTTYTRREIGAITLT